MFTSNRNGFRPPKHPAPCLQLFVTDDVDDSADAGRNLEEVGYLNVGTALHPVGADGRAGDVQQHGVAGAADGHRVGAVGDAAGRDDLAPMLSAFRLGGARPNAFHFQTQLVGRQRRGRGVLQPEQQRLRDLLQVPAAGGERRRLRDGPGVAEGPAEPAAARGAARQRPAGLHPRRVLAFGDRVIDPLHPPARRPGQPVGPRGQGVAGRRQVHPPQRRAEQPPADVLLARPGQPPVHLQPADRRRHLPHQRRQAGGRAGADAADQERPELQRAVAARGGAV